MDHETLLRPNALGKGPTFQSKTIERKMKAGVDILSELERAIFPMASPGGKAAWPQVLLFRRGRRNGTVTTLCGFGYERIGIDTEADRVVFTFRLAATGVGKQYEYQHGRFEFLEPVDYVCSLFERGPFLAPSKGKGRTQSTGSKPRTPAPRNATRKRFARAAWRQIKKELK